jgi:hypothetical protein
VTDFNPLDWVQDAAREQLRRKARRRENASFFESGARIGWRYKLWESYDAGQGWIVVTLIGMPSGAATMYRADGIQVLQLDSMLRSSISSRNGYRT